MSNNDLTNIIANAAKNNPGLVANALAQAKQASAVAPKQETKPAQPAPPPATPDQVKARDAKLLEVIRKFRTTDEKYLKADRPVGTFAVKVHSYFHACGVAEEVLRPVIEDACKRNVISRMSIPTRNNGRMMLYFDAKERPSQDRTQVPAGERVAVASVFGL